MRIHAIVEFLSTSTVDTNKMSVSPSRIHTPHFRQDTVLPATPTIASVDPSRPSAVQAPSHNGHSLANEAGRKERLRWLGLSILGSRFYILHSNLFHHMLEGLKNPPRGLTVLVKSTLFNSFGPHRQSR